MSLIRHSAWSAASAIAMMGGRFLATAFLARQLDARLFGKFAYTQWLVEICFLVTSLGATGVISRYAAEYRAKPELLAALFRRWRPLSLLLPCATGVAAVTFAGSSGIPVSPLDYAALIVWAVTNGVRAMHEAALTGLQRFDVVFKSNAVCAACMLAGSAFAKHAPTLFTAYCVMAIATTASCLMGVAYVASAARSPATTLPAGDLKVIHHYAVRIWLTALLWNLLWSRGEVPVLRIQLGDRAVAHYSVALSLYGGAVAAVMLGIAGLAPHITRARAEKGEAAAAALCRTSMDYQLLVCAVASSILICFSPQLTAIFGRQYTPSAEILIILAVGLPSMAVATHNHLLQISTGANFSLISTLAGAIGLVGLAWLGTHIAGEIGAAWSRAATVLALAALTSFVSKRRWGASSAGLSNLAAVATCLVAAALAAMHLASAGLMERTVGFVVLTCALCALIRDTRGAAVVCSLCQRMRRAYSIS